MIQVKQVSKVYGDGPSAVHALRSIDLEIHRGEALAFAGPSGSGKTTLLNILGCLDRPTSGTVVLDGRDLFQMSPREMAKFRAQSLGFIFQDFNLFSVLSARENVEYPLLLNRVAKSERRKRCEEALTRVGLGDKLDRKPAQLSGGEKQRVAVARALVHRPLLVLADEPTANLDSETGIRIVDLLTELNRELGTTLVISTHDRELLARIRRVVSLRDGRTIASGEPSNLGPVKN